MSVDTGANTNYVDTATYSNGVDTVALWNGVLLTLPNINRVTALLS